MAYKITRFYDIQCCDCGRWYSTDFRHGMEMNKELLESRAEKEGWSTLRGKGNLCPVCNHKMSLREFMNNYQLK